MRFDPPADARLTAHLQRLARRRLWRTAKVVLHPRKADDAPKRLGRVQMLPAQSDAMCVIADTARAAIYTDAQACLDRGENRAPHTQHLRAASDQQAVRELLKLLALKPAQRRKPSEKLGAKTIKHMLARALAELREERPDGVRASIEPDDEHAAKATLDRYQGDPCHGGSPTDGMNAVTAGIAWERIVIETARGLCGAHEELEYVAARWPPPQGGIDLDVIVADHAKRIVWVIDATNSAPTHQQQGTMIHQLRVLYNDSPLLPDGWAALGVIVHRAKQLPRSPRQTEHRSILRSALQDLPRLLLAGALPDQRVG
jgi:hypothetical protein